VSAVAAGLLHWVCEAAERRYGIAPREVLEAALLDDSDVSDPSTRVPTEALADAFRFLLARTGDPGFALQLAGPLELRTQGFWGYALLSSLTLRQRFELHRRYQALVSPVRFSYREELGLVHMEFQPLDVPVDVEPLIVDWSLAGSLHQLRRHLHPRIPAVQLWVTYAEQPHHAALRALAGGPVVFEAACYRMQLPASDLDAQLGGDPHLGKLACQQLDDQLVARSEPAPHAAGLLEAVRGRLAARLHHDASLPRVARDLRIGARTLQRQLEGLGASFQTLLEEARRARAVEYLVNTDEAVERIALRLGYGDPSNFRRAFRRWMGVPPATFRAQHRRSKKIAAGVAPVHAGPAR
jgi:AraC-like DNA-binding protein